MQDAISVALVIILFYPLMSVFEWLIHRYLMHRKSFPAWVYVYLPSVKTTLDAHAKFHHGECYQDSFGHDDKLPCRLFNLTLDIPWVPLVLVSAGLAFVSYYAAGILIALVIAHHLLWGAVHREMHIPGSAVWVRRLPMWNAWYDYHEKHHEQPGRNFNILCLGADYLFGTLAK